MEVSIQNNATNPHTQNVDSRDKSLSMDFIPSLEENCQKLPHIHPYSYEK